jgi:glycosyltransferase involved in cell wall biosynthesis
VTAALWLAANQPRMGGGEVMLLRCAAAARELGVDVGVVAPADPDETALAAADLGLPVVALAGAGRRGYARALRRWDRSRTGVLWCHGLVPALATAGRPRRLVHLHQEPRGQGQRAALAVARSRALRVLVPSTWMTTVVPGSTALANWTEDVTIRAREPEGPRVGFLGRTSDAKGTDVLARAVTRLNAGRSSRVGLVVAGDDRFVDAPGRERTDAALIDLGGDLVRWGWTDPVDFLGAVDVVAVPSVRSESFGLVAAEAMAARVPVVVSDAGALPEVVGPGHPWVVRAGDDVALADALAEVLDGDPLTAVESARARWERHWSPSAGRRRTADLLRDLGLLPAEART